MSMQEAEEKNDRCLCYRKYCGVSKRDILKETGLRQ